MGSRRASAPLLTSEEQYLAFDGDHSDDDDEMPQRLSPMRATTAMGPDGVKGEQETAVLMLNDALKNEVP